VLATTVRDVRLRITFDDDGAMLVQSDDVPGLCLGSRSNHDGVWRDIGPALKFLLEKNHDWPTPSSVGETVQ